MLEGQLLVIKICNRNKNIWRIFEFTFTKVRVEEIFITLNRECWSFFTKLYFYHISLLNDKTIVRYNKTINLHNCSSVMQKFVKSNLGRFNKDTKNGLREFFTFFLLSEKISRSSYIVNHLLLLQPVRNWSP